MGVIGYRQIMDVDLASTLPMPAGTGDLAYAIDTDRFYRYKDMSWQLIPNEADLLAMKPKTYVNGIQATNQRLKWIDSTTVAGGAGNATFYITSDRTSTGTARATTIDMDSIMVLTSDGTSQYAFGAPTSPNIKTIVIPILKQAFSGAVVLGINLLGSVTNAAAPNGTAVRLTLDGDAA